jgi:hypothetical protein
MITINKKICSRADFLLISKKKLLADQETWQQKTPDGESEVL